MPNTLATRLWPSSHRNLGAQLLLVLAGTALLTLSAKVQIPFWPVPMTMQTFVVLLIGAAYGLRLGGATVLAYLGQGAAGLPVFAAGGGLAYLTGPTAGYLLGFLVAAMLVGWLAERGFCRSRVGTLATFGAGTLVIFGLGAGWLGVLFGAEVALTSGVAPFLLSEALKIALAVAVVPLAWKLGRC